MRNTITKIDPTIPIVQTNTGTMRDQFRIFTLQVQSSGLLIDTGSPAGVVAAEQGAQYMDDAGAPGSVLYLKQLADVAGDKTQGWVLIG